MEFNLNIKEENIADVFNAFADKYNYQSEIQVEEEDFETKSIPNPETIDMFCKRMVVDHIKTITKDYLLKKARYQAEAIINEQLSEVEIN